MFFVKDAKRIITLNDTIKKEETDIKLHCF